MHLWLRDLEFVLWWKRKTRKLRCHKRFTYSNCLCVQFQWISIAFWAINCRMIRRTCSSNLNFDYRWSHYHILVSAHTIHTHRPPNCSNKFVTKPSKHCHKSIRFGVCLLDSGDVKVRRLSVTFRWLFPNDTNDTLMNMLRQEKPKLYDQHTPAPNRCTKRCLTAV